MPADWLPCHVTQTIGLAQTKQQRELPEYRLCWNVSPVLLSLCCFLTESVTEVRTNIYVTSFGPVSDTDMVSVSLLPLLCLITSVSHQIRAGHQSSLRLLVWLWLKKKKRKKKCAGRGLSVSDWWQISLLFSICRTIRFLFSGRIANIWCLLSLIFPVLSMWRPWCVLGSWQSNVLSLKGFFLFFLSFAGTL